MILAAENRVEIFGLMQINRIFCGVWCVDHRSNTYDNGLTYNKEDVMTLVFFLIHVAMTLGTILLFLAPVGYLIVRAKRKNGEAPVMMKMPDKEYKVNVRAAKAHLKSRGIVLI